MAGRCLGRAGRRQHLHDWQLNGSGPPMHSFGRGLSFQAVYIGFTNCKIGRTLYKECEYKEHDLFSVAADTALNKQNKCVTARPP